MLIEHIATLPSSVAILGPSEKRRLRRAAQTPHDSGQTSATVAPSVTMFCLYEDTNAQSHAKRNAMFSLGFAVVSRDHIALCFQNNKHDNLSALLWKLPRQFCARNVVGTRCDSAGRKGNAASEEERGNVCCTVCSMHTISSV